MKNRAKNVLILLLAALVMWVAITTIIQRAACKSMSETELFLRIPKSFLCNFKVCN